MLDINQHDFQDHINFEDYENSSILYEAASRQRPPFFPMPEDENLPPVGNFPPAPESPPGFNFPGGAFNPPGMPKGAPPNYTPNKNAPGVQSFNLGGPTISPQAVSANSIRFCLYKYTYIWERNGRNYWAFLLNVDRRSVSGFRWTGRYWIYFGIDLRRIDSFVCYRSESNENCNSCESLGDENIVLENNKREYSRNEIKDVYTQTLTYVNIPEVKEDYVTRSLGAVDNIDVKSDIPCIKIRNICNRITLEVAYPNNFNEDLKKDIIKSANEAGDEASKIFDSERNYINSSNSLENFNNSISLIPNALNVFADSFNSKLHLLNPSSEKFNNITYCIRNEKIYNDWKPYFSAL